MNVGLQREDHTAESGSELNEDTVIEGTGAAAGSGRLGSVSVRYSLIVGDSKMAPLVRATRFR